MASDVYECRVNYVDTGDRMQSVLHYTTNVANSPTPELQATHLATFWWANYTTFFLNCLPASTFVTSVSAKRINNTGGPSFYGGLGTSVTGSSGVDQKVDGSICALLTAAYNESALPGGPSKFRTARMFMGCVPFNWLVENQWSTNAIAYYGALATALNGSITGGGDTFSSVVWSRKYAGFVPLTTWSWVPTIACIRKRAFPAR